MLSTIGFIAVLLIVFTVGFVVGRKPLEPIKINVKFDEFAVEDLELCRDLLEGAAERIQEELDSCEDEEESEETSLIEEEDNQKE